MGSSQSSPSLKRIQRQIKFKFDANMPATIVQTIYKYKNQIKNKQNSLNLLLILMSQNGLHQQQINNFYSIVIQSLKLCSACIFTPLQINNSIDYFSHVKFTKLDTLDLTKMQNLNFQPLTWLDAPNLYQLNLNCIQPNSLKFLAKTNFVNFFNIQIYKQNFFSSFNLEHFWRMRTSERHFEFLVVIEIYDLKYHWVSKHPQKNIKIKHRKTRYDKFRQIQRVRYNFCKQIRKVPKKQKNYSQLLFQVTQI